jgi:hypothetical protein
MDRTMPLQIDALAQVLSAVEANARAAGVFGAVRVEGDCLHCEAEGSAEPATYQVKAEDDGLFVALVMEDRWQSQSIEAELVHSGDKLDDLIEEEMVDLGYDGPKLGFEHFRSPEMLYVFRSRLPVDGRSTDDLAATATAGLLAYHAVFGELGDMAGGNDD